MNLVAENVVVTASKFNPTILSQFWLTRKGIIKEADFLDGCIFTPVLVQVQTRQFTIFAIDERLQLSFQPGIEGKAKLVNEVLGRIVSELPETPYTAAGINFVWQFAPKLSAQEVGRTLFPNQSSPIYRAFQDESALFGGYFSKDALDCFRLKLTALPIDEAQPDPGASGNRPFQFQFNFHADVKTPDKIIAALEKWGDAEKLARDMMATVEASV